MAGSRRKTEVAAKGQSISTGDCGGIVIVMVLFN